MYLNNKVELLSPAGNMLSLKAAVNSGANAVYLGTTKLNARMSAENFNEENIESSIKYAKLRNVKVYITLNTLVYNEEIEYLVNTANKLHSFGADAIIVQDFGVLNSLINNTKINIHASTQMAIHNSDGAKFLEDLGVERVILSRETSIEKIKEIKANTNIELETFIHGALCSSFSGQCLISFLHGGRSGNRGTCAQPCRESYKGASTNYPLSTKDLMSLDVIPSLIDSKVSSLKIEGRMKRPEYVSVVTSVYRRAIDLAYEKKDIPVEKYREELIKIFNRGGFSTGYLAGSTDIFGNDKPNHQGEYIGEVVDYKKNKIYIKTKEILNVYDGLSFGKSGMEISDLYQNGRRVESGTGNLSFSAILKDIDIGDKVYRTTDKLQIERAREIIESDNFKHYIKAKCIVDKYITLILYNDYYSVEYKSKNELEYAKNKAATKEDILIQLKKTGGTVFSFESDEDIEIIIKGNYFIPIKEINEVRRNAVYLLESEITKAANRDKKEKNIITETTNKNIDTNMKVLISNDINIDREGYKYFFYSPKVYDDNIIELFNNKKFDGIVLPHITFDNDIDIIKNIVLPDMIVLCNNIGQLNAFKNKCHIWASIGLNAINNSTVDFLYSLGCDVVISSIECRERLKNTIAIKGGLIPIMHFVNCPKMAAFGCENCKEKNIIDKKGKTLIFECTTIKNKVSYILEDVNLKNGNVYYNIKY